MTGAASSAEPQDSSRQDLRLGSAYQALALFIRDTRALWIVGTLSVTLTLLRIAYITHVPDLDGDAYAHYEIGRAVWRDPSDFHAHWVWLPGYHFFIAGLRGFGATFRDVRIVNALLQGAVPFLLLRYARSVTASSSHLLAAVLFCLGSLPSMLGTSALGEVLFTLLVLAATYAIDDGAVSVVSATLGGIFLTLACSMRYEAWAAAAAVAVVWTVHASRAGRAALRLAPAFVIPLSSVLGYVVWRRVVDGRWLWFMTETLAFTTMQRHVLARSELYEALAFPVILPFKLVGPAVIILPLSLLGPWRLRHGAAVPIALAAFLVLVYTGRGILGLPRYYGALFPFMCLLTALAIDRACRRHPRYRRVLTALVVASFVGATLFGVGTTRATALDHQGELRAWEQRISE